MNARADLNLLWAHIFEGMFSDVAAKIIDPAHHKTNKLAFAPSEDSDQPEHLPILIRVFALRSVGR